MVVLREMRRRARFLVTPVLGIAVACYFAYHLVEGDRGLRAWFRVTQDLRTAKTNLASVQAERAALDRGQVGFRRAQIRSEEHTSELQSPDHLVCRLLL